MRFPQQTLNGEMMRAQSIARTADRCPWSPSRPLGAATTPPPARGLCAAPGVSCRQLLARRVPAPRRVGDRQQRQGAARSPSALGHLLQRLLVHGHGREHQPQVTGRSAWSFTVRGRPASPLTPGLLATAPLGWGDCGALPPSPSHPSPNVLRPSGLLGLGLPGKTQDVLAASSRGTSGELEWEFPWCLPAHPIHRPGPLWRRNTCMDGLSSLCWGVGAASQLGIFTGSWASEITQW